MHKNTHRYFIYCAIIKIFGALWAVKQKKKSNLSKGNMGPILEKKVLQAESRRQQSKRDRKARGPLQATLALQSFWRL